MDRYATLVNEAGTDGIRKMVVAAVITKPNRDARTVLIVQRPDDDFMGGMWELPSGTVESSESLDEALQREVQEETGLTLDGIGEYLGHFDYSSRSGSPTRQFTFAVTTRSTQPVTLTGHIAYDWKPIDRDLPVSAQVKLLLV